MPTASSRSSPSEPSTLNVVLIRPVSVSATDWAALCTVASAGVVASGGEHRQAEHEQHRGRHRPDPQASTPPPAGVTGGRNRPFGSSPGPSLGTSFGEGHDRSVGWIAGLGHSGGGCSIVAAARDAVDQGPGRGIGGGGEGATGRGVGRTEAAHQLGAVAGRVIGGVVGVHVPALLVVRFVRDVDVRVGGAHPASSSSWARRRRARCSRIPTALVEQPRAVPMSWWLRPSHATSRRTSWSSKVRRPRA